MGQAVTFVAEYDGHRFTRTSRTVTYTHVTLANLGGVVVDARWSKTEKAAATKLPNGWESGRVAVVACYPEGQEPKTEAPAAPAAELELCVSNSNAKGMHYRATGQQVSLCGKAKTSRKPNTRQLADNEMCSTCAVLQG